jgi:hypothetical protein
MAQVLQSAARMASSINPYEPPRELTAAATVVHLPRPIRSAGRISWEDALEAQRLAMNSSGRMSPQSRLAVFWLLWGLFLFSSLMAVGQAPDRISSYVFLGIVLFIAGAVYYPHARLRKEWKRGVGVFTPAERVVTQEGIERKTEEGSTTMLWSRFYAQKQSDRVVILYNALGGSYVVFSRATFAHDDDWQTFLDFVRAKFPAA